MESTPYFAVVAGFSSVLSLAMVSLSPCSAAMASRAGAICRHGPHHSAQKSTRTGLSLCRTFSSKSASVTVMVAFSGVLASAMVVLLCAGRGVVALRLDGFGGFGVAEGRQVAFGVQGGGT